MVVVACCIVALLSNFEGRAFFTRRVCHVHSFGINSDELFLSPVLVNPSEAIPGSARGF